MEDGKLLPWKFCDFERKIKYKAQANGKSAMAITCAVSFWPQIRPHNTLTLLAIDWYQVGLILAQYW